MRLRVSTWGWVLALALPLSAQQYKSLTSVSLFQVFPGKQGAFVEKGKQMAPLMDKLLADGLIRAYGVDIDMLHVPGQNNAALWFEAADFGAIGKAEDALQQFLQSHPAILSDMGTIADMAKHHDLIARNMEEGFGKIPAGVMPVEDFDMVQVKQGRMGDFMAMFRKYDKPVLDALVQSGAIYGYQLSTEAVHTMKPGMVWGLVLMPDLGAKDKVRAAFDEAYKKLPEAEQKIVEKLEDDMVEAGTHRDSLSTSMVFRRK